MPAQAYTASAASAMVTRLMANAAIRSTTTAAAGNPRTRHTPNHTGKIAYWTAAATPTRYRRPASSAQASPAATPITEEIPKLAKGPRKIPEIVAAQYAGIVGVPAIFPRWCFRELHELRGDRGAQLLIQRFADRVVRLPMPSAELDIDAPEDLLALEASTQVKRRQLADS